MASRLRLPDGTARVVPTRRCIVNDLRGLALRRSRHTIAGVVRLRSRRSCSRSRLGIRDAVTSSVIVVVHLLCLLKITGGTAVVVVQPTDQIASQLQYVGADGVPLTPLGGQNTPGYCGGDLFEQGRAVVVVVNQPPIGSHVRRWPEVPPRRADGRWW